MILWLSTLPAYLWVQRVCVDDGTLDVWQVCVVLQGPHVQASLFAQLSDAGLVVMGQGTISQDSVRNLRRR